VFKKSKHLMVKVWLRKEAAYSSGQCR
jgi:hypothetical protein